MPYPRAVVLGLVVAAALILASAATVARIPEIRPASKAIAAPAPAPSPSPSPSPSPLPVAPLTGMEASADVASRPAIAVKIENSAKARPQSGIEVADVVFEELTEGGVTRFIAVFQSQVPDQVGPVRSARLVDVNIVPAYGGILAMSGARDDVISALRNAGIRMLADDGRGTLFYRESSRRAPSNLYAAGEGLFGAVEDRGPAAATGPFGVGAPAGASACPPAVPAPSATPATPEAAPVTPACADPGASITVRMSRVSITGWEYDAAAGLYRRSQDGQPHTVTGEGRIGAANVLVLATDIGPGPCCDPAGNPMTATRVTGEGRGVLLRDGQRYEITWSKSAPGEHFRVFGPDGGAIAFKPGPTWVLLAPKSGVPAVG